MRASGVPRDELYVSSKLAAEIKDYAGAVAAIDGSLAAMGLEYLDLMMIHSPQPWNDWRGGSYAEGNREAWRALEEAHDAGKLRSIGVSNFEQADLENIFSVCTVPPQVNQVLVHVGNTPTELLGFCTENNLLVEAYSPIAHGEILGNEEVRVMAERYSVTVPQLCIRYTLQLGTVPLPKTTNPEHMRTNSDVDFVISDADMETLHGMRVTDYGQSGKFPVFSGK